MQDLFIHLGEDVRGRLMVWSLGRCSGTDPMKIGRVEGGVYGAEFETPEDSTQPYPSRFYPSSSLLKSLFKREQVPFQKNIRASQD
jgi:hypothetical protein